MKPNMGTADRVIRTLIALVIAVLFFTGRIHGALGVVLGVVALAFLITSAVGRCPAYVPLRLSTCKRPPSAAGT